MGRSLFSVISKSRLPCWGGEGRGGGVLGGRDAVLNAIRLAVHFQYFQWICNSLQSLTLKAPTFWKRSHLKYSDLPAILSRVEQVITGVLWIYGAILWAASCTSWMVITASLVEGEVILQNAKGMNHSRVQKYCKACIYFYGSIKSNFTKAVD